MLDSYIGHIESTENKSLIARIYGMFTFKTNYYFPLDLVIMQNTTILRKSKNRMLTFDLKGSIYKRRVGIPHLKFNSD